MSIAKVGSDKIQSAREILFTWKFAQLKIKDNVATNEIANASEVFQWLQSYLGVLLGCVSQITAFLLMRNRDSKTGVLISPRTWNKGVGQHYHGILKVNKRPLAFDSNLFPFNKKKTVD